MIDPDELEMLVELILMYGLLWFIKLFFKLAGYGLLLVNEINMTIRFRTNADDPGVEKLAVVQPDPAYFREPYTPLPPLQEGSLLLSARVEVTILLSGLYRWCQSVSIIWCPGYELWFIRTTFMLWRWDDSILHCVREGVAEDDFVLHGLWSHPSTRSSKVRALSRVSGKALKFWYRIGKVPIIVLSFTME